MPSITQSTEIQETPRQTGMQSMIEGMIGTDFASFLAPFLDSSGLGNLVGRLFFQLGSALLGVMAAVNSGTKSSNVLEPPELTLDAYLVEFPEYGAFTVLTDPNNDDINFNFKEQETEAENSTRIFESYRKNIDTEENANFDGVDFGEDNYRHLMEHRELFEVGEPIKVVNE